MKLLLLFVVSFIQLARQNEIPAAPSMFTSIRYCLKQSEMVNCFKKQISRSLDEVVKNDVSWPVTSYISIAKDPKWVPNITEQQQRSHMGLDEEIAQKLTNLVESRTVQVRFSPQLEEEGRKKKDKNGHGMLMMGGLAMAGMMAQLLMGKIAFMAGAALLVAKIALLLSSLVGLKKLVGSGGGSEHVVYTSTGDHGHGGWQRSIDEEAAQEMAYNAHMPRDMQGV